MSTNAHGEVNRKEPALSDTDLMPFGKFKGKPMQDVPPKYLKWLYNEIETSGATEQNLRVFNYIYNSWDALEEEIERE